MKKLQIYLLVSLLFSFSHCKKETTPIVDNPYGLPNATENGSMVFACRVNGQNRIAKNSLISQGGTISKDSTSVFGGFGTSSSYFENVALQVYGDVKINFPYNLDDSVKTRFFYDSDSTCFGISSNVVKVYKAYGTVIFSRLDSINRIVSGTFSFKIPIPDCDTLNFTEGRFDVKYIH